MNEEDIRSRLYHEIKYGEIGIGKRINLVRGGASLEEFSQQLGIHKNTLSRYEKGESYPDVLTIYMICEIRKVNPIWLIFGKGQKELIPSIHFAPSLKELLGEIRKNLYPDKAVAITQKGIMDHDKLQGIKKGKYIPSIEELKKLCDFLKISFPLNEGAKFCDYDQNKDSGDVTESGCITFLMLDALRKANIELTDKMVLQIPKITENIWNKARESLIDEIKKLDKI